MRLLRNYKHPQLQANWGRKVSVCFHQTHDRGLIMWWQAVSCAEFSQADPLLWSPLFSPGEVNSSSRDPCPWSSGHTQNDKSCFFRNFWMSSRARSIKLLSFHRMNKSLSLQPNPHWECCTSVLFPLHPIHMKRPVTGANGGEFLTCPPIYSPQRAGNPTGGYWATRKSVPSLGGRVCIHSPSVQFSSVAQSCLTLCDAMDGSTPGFPVHHQFLELAQTHIHQVSDTIQPSHPQSSPSPAVNLSQHQGLFQWVSSTCIRWPKYWSFSFNISPSNEHQDGSPLGWTGWTSLQSKGLSRVFSNTTVQKHQFFGTQLSSQSNSHIHIWLLEKP